MSACTKGCFFYKGEACYNRCELHECECFKEPETCDDFSVDGHVCQYQEESIARENEACVSPFKEDA